MKMIRKRKSKKETTLKNSKSKSAINSPNEECNIVGPLCGSPILNVHIHVPSCDVKDSNIHIPQIQPVIHLHFDDIIRKLDYNKNTQNVESLYNTFVNNLPVASPKVDNVILHVNKKSDEVNDYEAPCTIRRCSADSQLSKREKKKRAEFNASEYSKIDKPNTRRKTPENNIKDTSDELLLLKYKHLNLKKAVVVLTDICKSKTWKNFVPVKISDGDKPEDEIESPGFVNLEGIYNREEEDEKSSIKQESLSLCSLSPNTSNIIDSCVENESDKVKEESSSQKSVGTHKSLTELAEGYNFSEIINRFKLRYNIGDYAKCDNETGERCTSEGDGVSRGDGGFKGNSKTPQDLVDMNLIVENVTGNASSSFYEGLEENVEVKSEKSESFRDEETVIKNGSEVIGSVLESFDTDSKSDKVNNVTTESGLSSKNVIADSDTKLSSNIDVGNVDFHLQLIKKEMQRRNRMTSKKKKKRVVGKIADNYIPKTDPFAPVIKRKTPEKKPESSSSSPPENYIPLNISGPTKFAVAPLNEINPYEKHPARNFREEMLFGKRVKRFSNPDQMKVLQLKKQASSLARKSKIK